MRKVISLLLTAALLLTLAAPAMAFDLGGLLGELGKWAAEGENALYGAGQAAGEAADSAGEGIAAAKQAADEGKGSLSGMWNDLGSLIGDVGELVRDVGDIFSSENVDYSGIVSDITDAVNAVSAGNVSGILEDVGKIVTKFGGEDIAALEPEITALLDSIGDLVNAATGSGKSGSTEAGAPGGEPVEVEFNGKTYTVRADLSRELDDCDLICYVYASFKDDPDIAPDQLETVTQAYNDAIRKLLSLGGLELTDAEREYLNLRRTDILRTAVGALPAE